MVSFDEFKCLDKYDQVWKWLLWLGSCYENIFDAMWFILVYRVVLPGRFENTAARRGNFLSFWEIRITEMKTITLIC